MNLAIPLAENYVSRVPSSTSDMISTDEQVIELYKTTGDKKSLGRLFKIYNERLFGLAFYYLHDRDYALDTVMETFEVVLKTVGDKEITYFKGWLMSICRNICLKKIRDSKHYAELSQVADDFVENVDEEVYIDDSIDKLLEYIPKLKPHQSVCIKEFYLAGSTYEQISERHKMTFKEVKSYIQNGKRNLKVMFDKYSKVNE